MEVYDTDKNTITMIIIVVVLLALFIAIPIIMCCYLGCCLSAGVKKDEQELLSTKNDTVNDKKESEKLEINNADDENQELLKKD